MDGGTVTAPAGCGKTELIARALTQHSADRPVLVLTHTNSGVRALRHRLERRDVPPKAFSLFTIDGWALRLVTTFPLRSGHDGRAGRFQNPSADYPTIRRTAAKLLKSRDIERILRASYAHLLVDEYQDCVLSQHAMVSSAAKGLPTCVLGDPLQAIFGFGGESVVDWRRDVCATFSDVSELDTPWRWRNAGATELGDWILDIRHKLEAGNSIDLAESPSAVQWRELTAGQEYAVQLSAARSYGSGEVRSVLVIGDSRNPISRARIASQTPGAVTVEAVQMTDLIKFAKEFEIDAANALSEILDFAKSLMTGVRPAVFLDRVESLANHRARKMATQSESSALKFIAEPSYETTATLLLRIAEGTGVRKYRPDIFWAAVRALELCHRNAGLTLLDAATSVREQTRFTGRRLPKRTVGSTLLLKGLEADAAVILSADDLDAQNLYVGLSRATKRVVICSKTPVLHPH